MNNLNPLYSKFSSLDLGEVTAAGPLFFAGRSEGVGGLGRISILDRVWKVTPVAQSIKQNRSHFVSVTCFAMVLLCRFGGGGSSDGRFAFAQPRAAHHLILGQVIAEIGFDPGAHTLELVPHPQVEIIRAGYAGWLIVSPGL